MRRDRGDMAGTKGLGVRRGGRAREPPGREPRGTPCSCVSASRARRRPLPRTPCRSIAASRARRCPSPRTPCTCFAPSRARRCSSPRTPCTAFAPSRARRSLFPGTPCKGTLPGSCRARRDTRAHPRRARTSRRFRAPRPRDEPEPRLLVAQPRYRHGEPPAHPAPVPAKAAPLPATHEADAAVLDAHHLEKHSAKAGREA